MYGFWRREASRKGAELAKSFLSPRRVHGLADQERRIRALTRPEFLHPSAVDLRNVEVPLLIDAEAVDAPEAARKISPDTE